MEDVKYIETITDGDLLTSKMLSSVYRAILKAPSRLTGYEFIFLDGDGILTLPVKAISCSDKDLTYYKGWRSNFVQFVKAHGNDGRFEYAFKFFNRDDNHVVGKKLVSLFMEDGMWNGNVGGWVSPYSLYSREYPHPRLVKLFNMYNERIDAGVESEDKSIAGSESMFNNFKRVYMYIHSAGENGRAISLVDFNDRKDLTSHCEQRVCCKLKYSSPPEGYELWNNYPPSFHVSFRTSYIKSFYANDTRTRFTTRLLMLDDLISVKSGKHEIWNNLDQTILGNV